MRPWSFPGADAPGLALPGADELASMLRRAGEQRDGRFPLRIFSDGDRVDGRTAVVLAAVDTAGDGSAGAVLDKIRTQLGGAPVGLVVNHAQEWSARLVEGLGGFLRGLYDVVGLPSAGVELIAFWGDYPATPFGAHQDFEDAVFFHLGPGRKTMHLWEPDVFVALTGSSEPTPDFEPLLDHAHSFDLAPGDVLFHPRNWFHVAVQDGPSASVSAGLCDASTRSLLADLAGRLAETGAGTRIPPVVVASGSAVKPWREPVVAAWQALVSGALADLMYDRMLRRLSNAGFISQHYQLFDHGPEVTPRSVVRVRAPFSLISAPSGQGRIAVYGRHRRVEVVADPGVHTVVDLLNAGNVASIDAIAERLGPRWPAETVACLVRALAATGAVEVVQ